ncbi:unnamed protein product [Linum trigynum]|uniref:Uncharacterized protein n=1 Tax=Linum trigynum TaxID=586398 RepID=A0AAV2FKZ4_9ROSI
MDKTSIKLVSFLLVLSFLVAQYGGVDARASTLSQCKKTRDCGSICAAICSPGTTCACVDNFCSCNQAAASVAGGRRQTSSITGAELIN